MKNLNLITLLLVTISIVSCSKDEVNKKESCSSDISPSVTFTYSDSYPASFKRTISIKVSTKDNLSVIKDTKAFIFNNTAWEKQLEFSYNDYLKYEVSVEIPSDFNSNAGMTGKITQDCKGNYNLNECTTSCEKITVAHLIEK